MEHLTLYHNCVLKDMQIFSTAQKGRSKFNIEKEVQVIYSYVMHKFFFFFRVWFLQLIYFECVDPLMLCDNESSFNLNILSILGIPFPILNRTQCLVRKKPKVRREVLYMFFSVFVREMNSFYNNRVYDIVRIIHNT